MPLNYHSFITNLNNSKSRSLPGQSPQLLSTIQFNHPGFCCSLTKSSKPFCKRKEGYVHAGFLFTPTRPNPGTITTNFVTSIFVQSTQKFAIFFPLPAWTQLFEGGLVLTQGKILILILFLLLKSISKDNFFIYYFWSIQLTYYLQKELTKLNGFLKFSYLNSNFALTLGYLTPVLNPAPMR